MKEYRRSASHRSDTDSLSIIPERYFTAGDAIPVSIPLEKVDMGAICFKSTDDDEFDDLQLLYHMNTAELEVHSNIEGSGNGKTGFYRIRGVRAANLELINPLAGYLEAIQVRLIIETDQNLMYRSNHSEESVNCPLTKEIHTHRVVLYASVHECGHLRDILLFMKSENLSLKCLAVEKENPYYNPNKHKNSEDVDSCKTPPLTYLSLLPWWALYIPWWVYSRRIRKIAQVTLVLYSVFSIVWATWQLYRHVNVIQLALAPIVQFFQVYLRDFMKEIDEFLAWFTHLSTTLLRPLNIFSGLVLVPLINLLLQFKNVLAPIAVPFLKLAGQLLRMAAPFTRCFRVIWSSMSVPRIAIQNVDWSQTMAKNLLLNSLRAIFHGMTRLVGYSKVKSKQHQALQVQAAVVSRGSSSESMPSSLTKRRQNKPNTSIPVYYSSPILKKGNM